MGQSLLIDMNSSWYKHKTEVNDGLKTGDYQQVLGALDSLNATLPPEYRVSIDTDEYNEKIKGNFVALCNFCTTANADPEHKDKTIETPTQTDVQKLRKMKLLLSSTEQLIEGKREDEFWECGQCKQLNKISKTRFRQTILKKPFYLKVVPEPPRKRLGVEDRLTYHAKFSEWARNFLSELNAEAQRFRQEYKPKDGEEGDELNSEIFKDDDLFD